MIDASQFLASRNAHAAIDNSLSPVNAFVTEVSVDNGIRAIVHELLKRDPTQKSVTLGAEEAKALYSIVKGATAKSVRNARPNAESSAHTREGLPSRAGALGKLAARAGRKAYWTGSIQDSASRAGTININPTVDYADTVGYAVHKHQGTSDQQSVLVQLGPDFGSTIRELMSTDAVSALAQNARLAHEAAKAQNVAQDQFLRAKNIHHKPGGPLERKIMSELSELPASERARLALDRDLATLSVVFGFKNAGVKRPTLSQCESL